MRQEAHPVQGSLRVAQRAEVDGIVISALEDRILKPERLADLLIAVLDRSDQALAARRDDLKNYRAEKTRIEAAKRNLLELVEAGAINPATCSSSSA